MSGHRPIRAIRQTSDRTCPRRHDGVQPYVHARSRKDRTGAPAVARGAQRRSSKRSRPAWQAASRWSRRPRAAARPSCSDRGSRPPACASRTAWVSVERDEHDAQRFWLCGRRGAARRRRRARAGRGAHPDARIRWGNRPRALDLGVARPRGARRARDRRPARAARPGRAGSTRAVARPPASAAPGHPGDPPRSADRVASLPPRRRADGGPGRRPGVHARRDARSSLPRPGSSCPTPPSPRSCPAPRDGRPGSGWRPSRWPVVPTRSASSPSSRAASGPWPTTCSPRSCSARPSRSASSCCERRSSSA